jgi:hypothetical protein
MSGKNGCCIVKMGVVFQNILSYWLHGREELCCGVGDHVNKLHVGILP